MAKAPDRCCYRVVCFSFAEVGKLVYLRVAVVVVQVVVLAALRLLSLHFAA